MTELTYPHNLILEIAAEGGVIALLLFSLIIFVIIKRWFRPKTLENNFTFLLALLFFFASMFSGSIYDTRFMWIFLTLYMLENKNTTSTAEELQTYQK